MAIDFGSQGLAYTHDLCEAIERYGDTAEKLEPNAFVHRKMQLRYAVERRLYIQCINSEALFQYYLTRSDNACLPSAYNALSILEGDIAAFFPDMRVPAVRPYLRMARKSYLLVKQLRGWLYDKYRRKPQQQQQPGPYRKILIHVVNAKFSSYLLPLTRQLGMDHYAFLATCDHDLARSLEKAGQPVVDWYATRTRRPAFTSVALSEFSQLTGEADITLEALTDLKPECVLVVEGNAPLDVITSEACKLLGIPCFCIQHGWSPYIHSGFRNMTYTEMFMWGERFTKMLQPYNPDQKFRVTGSHAVQVTPPSNHTQAVGPRVFSFFLQAPCALLGIEAFNAFVDMIVNVSASNPTIQMVIREHAGYPLPVASKGKFLQLHNVRFSNPLSEPLADVIVISELVISVFSTVLLEALAMNVIPLICSIGSMQRYEPDLVTLGVAIEVQSIEEARQVMVDIIADPAKLDPYRTNLPDVVQEFFSNQNATLAIANRLLSASESSTAGIPA